MAKPKKLTRITPFRWISNPAFRAHGGKTHIFNHDGRNRAGPERLTSDQKETLERMLGRRLQRHEWSSIEKVRTGYVRDRHTLAEALTESEIKKYFSDFVKAAGSLLEACGQSSSRREAAAREIWKELHAFPRVQEFRKRGGGYPLETPALSLGELHLIPSDFTLFVRMLQGVVARGSGALVAYTAMNKAVQFDSFNRLIGSLKFVFEAGGTVATAAKSSRAKRPKPSAFVHFVWNFMETLPRDVREHMHSVSAMEKAVSSELKVWRRPRMQSGRTDYYLY